MLSSTRGLSAVACLLALAACTDVEVPRGPESRDTPAVASEPAAATPGELPTGPPTVPPSGFVEPPGALYAAPDGHGAACNRTDPCSLLTALTQSHAGATVALLDGDYGELTISAVRALERSEGPVIVMPAQGATPVVRSLDLRSPNTAWHGIRFTGSVMIRAFAPDTELRGVHVDGAGVFVRARNVTVRDSLLENGVSTDGIQVGQAEAVEIVGNRIRNYAQKDSAGFHSDCIQMFDSRDVTIRANVLTNCYNASLIFSPGRGDGTHQVLIESNFVQGCLQLDAACRGGVALDMRTTDSNTAIVVRNNTFVDGAVRVGTLPGSFFDRNYVQYLSYCETPMTNSVISSWNEGLCASPDNLGKDGNRHGSFNFADQAATDLRVQDSSLVEVFPVSGLMPAPRDIFGNPFDSNIAGGYAPP